MTSEKGIYWIAVGVLALIVTNNFSTKHEFASRVADRSVAVAQQVACRGTQYLAALETFIGVQHSDSPQVEVAMMRAHTKLASLQTMLASEQIGLAQLQCAKAHLISRQDFVLRNPLRQDPVRHEMVRRTVLLQNLRSTRMLLPQQNVKIELVSDASETSDDGTL